MQKIYYHLFSSEKKLEIPTHVRILHRHPLLSLVLTQCQKWVHLLAKVVVELIVKLLLNCLFLQLLVLVNLLALLFDHSFLFFILKVNTFLDKTLIAIYLVSYFENVWNFLIFVTLSMCFEFLQK